jgi:tetratricopeptide (TPR) repeat protein
LKSALERLVALRGPNDVEVAKVLNNTAYLHTLMADYSDVPQLLDRAIDIFTSRYGPRNVELINPLNNYGRYYTSVGRPEEAGRSLNEALAIGDARFGGRHPWIGRTFDLVAEMQLAENNFSKACEATKFALQVKSYFYDSDNLEMARTLRLQGACLLGLGLNADAKDDLTRAKQIFASQLEGDNIRLAEIDLTFAAYYGHVGDKDHTLVCLLQARKIADAQLGALHPFTKTIEKMISNLRIYEPTPLESVLC